MVTKITSPVTPLEVIGKVNEIIDDFTLDNLTNVSISSPSAGQNLTYDATNQVWKNTSSSATVAWGGITGTLSDQTDLNNALNGKVPTSRTINSKALTSDITLTASDVGALPNTTPIPTKTSDLTNDRGYITGITSSDVTSALGYTPYNSSNPSGYTSNVGTVTSVNNTSPDANGNVSLSIPTVNNATLTITQGGTTKGTFTANASSDVTIALDSGGGSVDVDNSTITLNSSDQLQTVAVKDNRSGNAIKTWTGTKSQYDAITTKDSNTLYNITDDTDVTLTLLNTLYPVGAIYIGTMNACPLQALGVGTWTLVSSGRVLQGTGTGQTVGSTVEAGLPNITGNTGINVAGYHPTGCFFADSTVTNGATASRGAYGFGIGIDASTSSSIYGNSTTVQPPAYLVNIWERIQ